MNRFLLPFILVIPFATSLVNAAQPPARGPEVIDGVAAVVNNEVITFSQVRVLSAPKEKLLLSQYRGPELAAKIKEARQAALEDLIDRQLIVQAFKKESYQVPDHFIDERVHEIIQENFGGDRNAFIKTLAAQDYTLGAFKKMETDKMMIQAMRQKNVKQGTVTPPGKLEEYYHQHVADYTSKAQVKLRLIMIPAKPGEEAGQKAMAEEILSKLVNGAEFDRMAQIYSEDSTRDLGGDWGWVDKGTLAGPLEKIAFNLSPGKISNIIDLSGNYYILKVEDRRGGVTRSFKEVRPDIEKLMGLQQAQAAQERWIAGLRQKAYIKTY